MRIYSDKVLTTVFTLIVDFGIDDTERLTHFQKPRPPPNRRRPRTMMPRGSSLDLAGGDANSTHSLPTASESEDTVRASPNRNKAVRVLPLPPLTETPTRTSSPTKKAAPPPPPPTQTPKPTEDAPSASTSPPSRIFSRRKSAKSKVQLSKSVPNLADKQEQKSTSTSSSPKATSQRPSKTKSIWSLFTGGGRSSRGSPTVIEKRMVDRHGGRPDENEDADVEEEQFQRDSLDSSHSVDASPNNNSSDVLSEESLVEKRERLGKVLRPGSLQTPCYSSYREYIKAAHQSMPESSAVMH